MKKCCEGRCTNSRYSAEEENDEWGYSQKHLQIRNRQIQRDIRWIKKLVKHFARDEKSASKKGVDSLTNSYHSFRYMAANLEALTGMPFYTTMQNIEDLPLKRRMLHIG